MLNVRCASSFPVFASNSLPTYSGLPLRPGIHRNGQSSAVYRPWAGADLRHSLPCGVWSKRPRQSTTMRPANNATRVEMRFIDRARSAERVAAHIAQDKPTVGPLELVVAEAAQDRRDPLAPFVGACCRSKVERMGAIEDSAHLVQGADLRFVQVNDHPVIITHPRYPAAVNSGVFGTQRALLPLETRQTPSRRPPKTLVHARVRLDSA
ncbi:hypothetical protein OKW45_001283 [Paraburkholderia sp. WSM4175]